MSFREKSTWLMLGVLVVVYGSYMLDVRDLLATLPVEEISYQTGMVWTVVLLIALIVVGEVVLSTLSPSEAGSVDERDRAIERVGDQCSGYMLGGFAIFAMAQAMNATAHFYIAQTLLGGLVLSEILKCALMLFYYRRGY